MTRKFIPVAAPALAGREREYVLDCLDTNWISSNGKYIDRFEQEFARFLGVEGAVSCNNGTTALHAALLALGVGPGDEVIVPTLTYVASANAIAYCGARPVFVDSDPETWNLDPARLEALVTPRTKGILAVHLYGLPVDMDPVLDVARRHGLFVLEDVAEAMGATYKGRMVGTLGDAATFSFYGNKIITTGEGGMIVAKDPQVLRRARQLKGQGQDWDRRYWFPVIGYNYRMTNLQAAIGLAQLEKVEWHLSERLRVADLYRRRLERVPGLQLPAEPSWGKSVYWLFSVVLTDEARAPRDDTMARLAQKGIETRPFFYPMHILPPYRDSAPAGAFPTADRLSTRGINLPTWAGLPAEDVADVCDMLTEIVSKP